MLSWPKHLVQNEADFALAVLACVQGLFLGRLELSKAAWRFRFRLNRQQMVDATTTRENTPQT